MSGRIEIEKPSTLEESYHGILIFILAFILCNVKISQFVNIAILVRSNDSQPIAHIVFLQKLLCQVLQVSVITEANAKSFCYAGLQHKHSNFRSTREMNIWHVWSVHSNRNCELRNIDKYKTWKLNMQFDIKTIIQAYTVIA